MKIGYMRECAAGPALAEQEALLRQAGIVDFSRHAPVYVDKHRKGPSADVGRVDVRRRDLHASRRSICIYRRVRQGDRHNNLDNL